jgi:hypothetical protein
LINLCLEPVLPEQLSSTKLDRNNFRHITQKEEIVMKPGVRGSEL